MHVDDLIDVRSLSVRSLHSTHHQLKSIDFFLLTSHLRFFAESIHGANTLIHRINLVSLGNVQHEQIDHLELRIQLTEI